MQNQAYLHWKTGKKLTKTKLRTSFEIMQNQLLGNEVKNEKLMIEVGTNYNSITIQ